MISKFFNIFEGEDSLKFKIILVLNFLTFFLEFISIVSIPIFVGLIFDSSASVGKFEEYRIFYFSKLDDENLIKLFGIIIVSIFLIKNTFYFILVYIQGKFVKNIKVKVSKKLLNFYVNSSFSYHTKKNPAELTRNSTETIEGLSTVILQGINLFKESLAVIVIFSILFFVNSIVTASVTIIFSLFGYFYLKKIRPSIKKKSELNEKLKINLIQMINESFGAIKDIKILNKENEIVQHYDKSRNKLEENLFYFNVFDKTPKLLLESLAILLITISSMVLFSLNKNFLEFIPVLSLIVITTVRFIPAFNSIITSLFYLRIYKPSINILSEELEKIKKFELKKPEIFTDKLENKFNTDLDKSFISLKDISFSYNEHKTNILENINLTIEKGTIVGITGETGSGKSTLFHIMLGLLPPSSGNVLFQNENIHSNIEKWRKQIGYIAQNIYLLDSTIEKNISFDFFEKKIDQERMDFSIKMSCLDKKILELPNGLQSRVGNDGVRLSGGEKQRIALARAIYRNPNIFFMDESTSALDTQTEQAIIKNIKENFSHKTIIMIAHRKTTINECDKIINLKNGNLNQ